MKWKEKVKKFGKPIHGKIYNCKFQHELTKKIISEQLKWVKSEMEGEWRTVEDNAEIDEWNWDILEWKLI